jgi:hypothetical protein
MTLSAAAAAEDYRSAGYNSALEPGTYPMTDTTPPRTTVSTNATATVRLRPALLLMLVRVRAAEATLELGLADLKQRCADTVRRLTRLGATRVETGEPHEDYLADPDPMARMRAAATPRRRRPADAPLPERRGVNVTLTASWEIAGLSAEAVLVLVDQLRFDAAADADPPEPPAELPPWAGPEEQLRTIMAQVTEPPPDDRSPKFLYVARPNDEQLARATAEAYAVARRTAERLAHAAGRRLGELASLNSWAVGADGRADQVMERQRCAALLAASAYDPREGEVVSEDPRAVGVTVSVHATHHLE